MLISSIRNVKKDLMRNKKNGEIKAGFGKGGVQSYVHDSTHALNIRDVLYNTCLKQEKYLYKEIIFSTSLSISAKFFFEKH